MAHKSLRIGRLFVFAISAAVASYANLFAINGGAAAYDYSVSQIAPPIASGLTMSQIETILEQSGGAMPYLEAVSK